MKILSSCLEGNGTAAIRNCPVTGRGDVMAARRIPSGALRVLWELHGVALCAEAQADGVPCPEIGKSCDTCEHALAAYLELEHPVLLGEPGNSGAPECGP
jgi:hypothetical protein